MSQIKVFMRHVRGDVGHPNCMAGIRISAKKYNLDLKEFIKNGLPIEDFLATGDSEAIKAAHRAIEEHHNGVR